MRLSVNIPMRLALVLVALVALGSTARAELWTSNLGDLMTTATRIEIVRVDQVTNTTIDGVVETGVRDARPGDAVHVDLARLAAPEVGDRVLVICDKYACPRAAAVDRGGWFQLAAQELMDGAFVTPSVVERDSLVPLAMGRPAADLCVTGSLDLIDDRFPPSFHLLVAAADGRGSGSLGRKRVTGTLSVPWYGAERGIEVRLAKAKHELELVADQLARGADGCYTATFVPTRPFVRTHHGLARALAGKATASILAHGTLDVPAGMPVPAGRHTFELSVDEYGQLVITSDLASARLDQVSTVNGHFSVGFSATTTDYYPLLQLDLGAVPSAAADSGATAALALAHLQRAEVSWLTHNGATLVTTPLGVATITYVRER